MNRRRRPALLSTEDLALTVPAPGADGTEEKVLSRVLDSDLVTGLLHLAPAQRDVVVLVDVEGLAYAETAAVLGVPEGTVMSRLHRARKHLRRHLERHGYEPPQR